MAKKNVGPISDGQIIAKLEELQRLEKETFDYFRMYSPLWRAIVDYITKSKPGECGLGDKKGPIRIYRGTGPGIFYKRAYAKPAGAHPHSDTTLRLCFDVTFCDEDEDREYRAYWMVDVPIDLAENFSKKKFNEWITGQESEHRARREKEALKTLGSLAKRHPKLVKDFARSLKG